VVCNGRYVIHKSEESQVQTGHVTLKKHSTVLNSL